MFVVLTMIVFVLVSRLCAVEADRPGRVILLNGPSSSGKSSIGRALQTVLDDPWFLFPVDSLGAMRSTSHKMLAEDQIDAMLRRTRRGYHRAVAALASVGNDVIMDYPLSEPWRLDDLLDVLRTCRVTLVDVHCDPDELDRRERHRADRPAGLARSQDVFGQNDRDITVDTTNTTARACAITIARDIASPGPDTAFDRLRSLRS
jgi:chloramphenicol 3-O phosphotransferase